MDILKQNKLAKWIIFLLIILNLATLSSIWINRSETMIPPPPPKERTPQDMTRFLKSELNLTDQQAEQINQLRKEHFLKINPIVNEVFLMKKSMMDHLFLSKGNSINADSLASLIGEKQSQIELLVYNHFNDLIEVCGEEQAKKLGRILSNAIGNQNRENMRPGAPPPHQRPRK